MDQIVVKTDGNPLFVEELTKTVLEAGILVQDAEGYHLDGPLPPFAIPTTLQDSLMARLDRLAPVREIAQIGAAIGREFSYALLSAVVAGDETGLKSALAQLEEAELVFRRGESSGAVYSFKHALVQEAAYESMLKSWRQVLHRRIAESLRDRFAAIAEPEVIAHHFTQAGLAEAAVEWWGKAGERAMNSSAYTEAITHLQKALGPAESVANGPAQRLLRLRLQTMYGQALFHARGQTAPETSAAFARARELAARVEDTTERASAYYGLWAASFVRGQLAPMQEMAEALLNDAQRWPESAEAGIAHRAHGMTCLFEGNYIDARVHLEKALVAYDDERDQHLSSHFGYVVGVSAMFWLAQALWPLGEIDRAVRLFDEGMRLAIKSGHIPTIAYAHLFTCAMAVMRRKPREVGFHAEIGLDLARKHGLPIWLAFGILLLGWTRWWAGEQDGEAGMREGLALLRDIGQRLLMPMCGMGLAEIEAESGRVDAGLATLDAQLAMIERTGERWFEAEVRRVRGELLLKRKPPDAEAAEAAFMHALQIARSQQTRTFELRVALSLAKPYQTTGLDEAARELLAPVLVGFSEGAEVPEVAEANRLIGSLSGYSVNCRENHRADRSM